MLNRCFPRGALVAALLVVCPRPASAQMYEAVGTRAQGMAGAFVAVADDATASWWNPAGLAAGAYFNIVIEQARSTDPKDPPAAGPASRQDALGFAAAFPSMGLSYYRLRVSGIAPAASTGGTGADRQDQGGAVGLRSMVTNQFGITAGQSMGRHFVFASTLKLVRAGSIESVGTADDALGQASDLEVPVNTRSDIDFGAMVALGHLRAGVGAKHMFEPDFGEGEDQIELKRQVRVGAAWMSSPSGALSGVTAAFDADLTTTATAVGEAKHMAGGAEGWMVKRRIGVRGGFSTNTVGSKGTSLSAGASLAPHSGFYIDGAWTFGSDKSREGWALGTRVTF